MTIQEAATALQVKTPRIYKLIAEGKLASKRLPYQKNGIDTEETYLEVSEESAKRYNAIRKGRGRPAKYPDCIELTLVIKVPARTTPGSFGEQLRAYIDSRQGYSVRKLVAR